MALAKEGVTTVVTDFNESYLGMFRRSLIKAAARGVRTYAMCAIMLRFKKSFNMLWIRMVILIFW